MDLSKLTIEETINQCSKPTGDIGIEFGKKMNEHHRPLIEWGLKFLYSHKKGNNFKILDIGCGAGLAISLLSTTFPRSNIFGIDYSAEMVKSAKNYNKNLLKSGNVIIQKGSVDKLPFEDNQFDLITATETIYFWPDLLENIKEVYRTLKNNATFAVINEDYNKSSNDKPHHEAMVKSDKINLLEENEHVELFNSAGFKNIKINTIPSKGWIVICGVK